MEPHSLDHTDYGPVIAGLLKSERVPVLGPGTPDRAVREQLESATVERLFAHASVRDRAMAEACRSGLWLYHDFLDQSHTISQSIETTTGSYWHGIMHRREPDFSNAAYWFRRVGRHPIFPALADAARTAAQASGALTRCERLKTLTTWDPFAFIDLCASVYAVPGPDHDLCRRISLIEWQLLFDHSYRHATGA